MEGDLFGLLPPQEDLLFAQSLAMLSNAWHQVFFPQERCSLAEAQSSRQGGPLCDESASHRSQVRGPWANGPMGRWGWENCIRKTCFSVMINESQSFEMPSTPGHGNIRGSTGGALALISAFGREKIWQKTVWHLKLLLMAYGGFLKCGYPKSSKVRPF